MCRTIQNRTNRFYDFNNSNNNNNNENKKKTHTHKTIQNVGYALFIFASLDSTTTFIYYLILAFLSKFCCDSNDTLFFFITKSKQFHCEQRCVTASKFCTSNRFGVCVYNECRLWQKRSVQCTIHTSVVAAAAAPV